MSKVHELITSKIIEKIEKSDKLPWHKPWTSKSILPVNAISKRNYHGINILLLYITSLDEGYSPYWLSYNKAKSLGGHVKKGEKGTPVIFYKLIEKDDPTEDDPDHKKKVPLLRYYFVYNIDQCELPDEARKKIENREDVEEVVTVESCEEVVNKYGIEVKHGNSKAYYHKEKDFIALPYPDDFDSRDDYYHALFHEMVHSTGHKDRLNRESVNKVGKDEYCTDELIAEIGSCFLSAHFGLDYKLENSSAYIKTWLKRLKDDPKLIIQASAAAQKAVDYILK